MADVFVITKSLGKTLQHSQLYPIVINPFSDGKIIHFFITFKKIHLLFQKKPLYFAYRVANETISRINAAVLLQ
jgi:hypothetical protein